MSFPRYPAYKDSGVEWLGEVPEHWGVAKTVRFFKVAMGQTILKEDLIDEGEWPVFSATDGDHYFGRINNPQVRLAVGDVVIPARGNSIGAVKIVKEPATTTQTTIYCKNLSSGRLDPQFVFHYLIGCKKNLFYFTQTAIPQITVEEVCSNPILIPPLPEQTAIATFLDRETVKIDAMVAEQENLIGLLKEKRQAVISHAVTKGLDPSVSMKDSGVEWLGEVPAHWVLVSLKQVITRIESGTSVNAIDTPASSSELGVLKTSCVYSGHFDAHENKAVVPEEYDRVACPVKAGSLIVSRMNTPDLVGAAGVVHTSHENLFLPDRLWQVYFDGAHPDFVHHWTHTPIYRAQVEMACAGTSSSMQNLGQHEFRCFLISLPPLSEQTAIATFLDRETASLDALIVEAQSAITLLQERRTALISAAVTGQIDVRNTKELSGEHSAVQIQGDLSLSELDDLFERTLVEISGKSSDDWRQETDELMSKMTPENRANFMDAIENLGRIFKDKNGSS